MINAINDLLRLCTECMHPNEDHEGYSCSKCGKCIGQNHCHLKGLECIAPIQDCWEHYQKCGKFGCDYGTHDECSCQEREY